MLYIIYSFTVSVGFSLCYSSRPNLFASFKSFGFISSSLSFTWSTIISGGVSYGNLYITFSKVCRFVYASFKLIWMCITYLFSVYINISTTFSCTYVSFFELKSFLLQSSSSSFTQSSVTTGDVSSGYSSVNYSKVCRFVSASFTFICLCITSLFWVSIFISPNSSCTSISFFSIKSFLLLSSSSSFKKISITTGDVPSGDSSIAYSKVSRLVSVLFSFMFLCIAYWFSVSIGFLHILHINLFFPPH